MKTIPTQTIDLIWNQINDSSESQVLALVDRMKQQQPFILVYLLACEENLNTNEEPGWLLHLGGVIFAIMSDQTLKLPKVSGEELEAAESANLKFLERLDEGREAHFADVVMGSFSSFNQRPLLEAVLEALMSEYRDDPELAPEHLGMGFLYLKTVIDCLDK
jgi:hypothetical protein